MELSVSTGLGRKRSTLQEGDFEVIHEPVAKDTLLQAEDPSPWSCFYCSADVKVSENAIKAIKSGKEKAGDGSKAKSEFHTYQQKKTFGQGMMDLALLTANVNQLRSLLDMEIKHPYYHVNLVFISMSIFFQVIVGISLICNSRANVNEEGDVASASKVNNFTFVCIFIVTIINIFLSVFYDMK